MAGPVIRVSARLHDGLGDLFVGKLTGGRRHADRNCCRNGKRQESLGHGGFAPAFFFSDKKNATPPNPTSGIRNGMARAAVGDNRAPIMPSTVAARTMTTITPIARSMARPRVRPDGWRQRSTR